MSPTEPEAGLIFSKQDEDIAAVYDRLAWIEHRADLFRLGIERRIDRLEARLAGSGQAHQDLKVVDFSLQATLNALDTFLASALAHLDKHLESIDEDLDEADNALAAALIHRLA